MIIKCIAWGFIWAGPKSYIKDPWNRLDAIVVVITYVQRER
jgi:hypothetical protein